MSNEVERKEDKKPVKISEGTKQLIANVVITAFSTAAMVISIGLGMKRKNKL